MALKIISVLSLLAIGIPTQKFSIPFGLILLADMSEQIREFGFFNVEILFFVLFILGNIFVFNSNKFKVVFGFLLLVFTFLMYVLPVKKNLESLFYVPLIIFRIFFFWIIYRLFNFREN